MERNKYVYDLVNKWIENADNKVSVACIVVTGVFTAVTFLAGNMEQAKEFDKCWGCFYQACTVISLFSLLLSILFYFFAISPNLGSNGNVQNESSNEIKSCPIFYGDIVKLSVEEYKNRMNSVDDKTFIDELQNEIHYNSGICIKKMKWYHRGLWLSFSAIVFSILRFAIRFLF